MTRSRSARRRAKSRPQRRDALENPNIPLTDPRAFEAAFGDWYGSESGETVNAAKALQVAAVFQGVDLISGDCAKIPLAPFRRDGKGGKERASDHSTFRALHRSGSANEETSSYEFWRRIVAQAVLWGNGYGWLDWGPGGELLGAYNLLPDRTEPWRRANGELWYVTEIDGKREFLAFRECLHVRRFSLDNRTGVALLDAARNTIGLALAKAKFESKFFKNNASLGGVLTVPPGTDPAARDNLERDFSKRYQGTDSAFKVAVLRDGAKFVATQPDPQKALLGTLDEMVVRTVARFLNVPPGRLGAQDSKSYASADAERRDYHDSTLSPWLESIAGECTVKLLTPAERAAGMFFEHQVNALLWADAQTRSQIGAQGVMNGIYSPDEVRSWENLPPRADGKGGEYMRPLNTASASEGTTNGETDEARASAREVARTWLREAWGRAVGRLDKAAARLAGGRDASTFDAQHRDALVEILKAPFTARHVAGDGEDEVVRSRTPTFDVASAVDDLLAEYSRAIGAGDLSSIEGRKAAWELSYLA